MLPPHLSWALRISPGSILTSAEFDQADKGVWPLTSLDSLALDQICLSRMLTTILCASTHTAKFFALAQLSPTSPFTGVAWKSKSCPMMQAAPECEAQDRAHGMTTCSQISSSILGSATKLLRA